MDSGHCLTGFSRPFLGIESRLGSWHSSPGCCCPVFSLSSVSETSHMMALSPTGPFDTTRGTGGRGTPWVFAGGAGRSRWERPTRHMRPVVATQMEFSAGTVLLVGHDPSGAIAVRAKLRQRCGPTVDHVSTCVLPRQFAFLGNPRPELSTAEVLHGDKERGTYLMRLRTPFV